MASAPVSPQNFSEPFDAPVEQLHRRLHVTARPRQPLLAISWVVHTIPVMLQITELLGKNLAWLIVGQRFSFFFGQWSQTVS